MPARIIFPLSRRDLLVEGSKLSAVGVAVLAGVGTAGFSRAARAADTSKDVDTLNAALALENKTIGGYQVGVDSGLLKQASLNLSLLFQSHHKAHRDALTAAIQKLGGAPVAAQTNAEYAKSFEATLLKTEDDILNMALRMEFGAADAYVGMMPSFQGDLAKLSARILADESMHWTALASTLRQPLPAMALTFGA